MYLNFECDNKNMSFTVVQGTIHYSEFYRIKKKKTCFIIKV